MAKPKPPSPEPGRKAEVADKEADELKSRLEALKVDLGDVARDKAENASRAARSDDGAIGTGLRAGSELLAGVIVGGAIGYLLDGQFGVSPLFLIIFMMMGMGAGFWNVYRLAARTKGGDAGTKK